MTPDTERYISLAQGVSAHAQAGTLDADTAVRFCKAILPALLVEIELAQRLDARLSQMFPAPAAGPQPECGATICSNRWSAPAAEPQSAKKKRAAKRAKKAKKRGGKHDDLPS